MDKMEKLKALMASGAFHHATWRDVGKLWEGWHIYVRADDAEGFRGFKHEMCFYKNDPQCSQAGELLRSIGTSLGSYGRG
jgi:hypothetical protein